MSQNTYAIYQIKGDEETRKYQHITFSGLKAAGLSVECRNYKHVYTGTLEPGDAPASEKLDALLERFSRHKPPQDFPGRALSISDIVVLRCDGKAAAYYIDTMREYETPEFLNGPYRYYLTDRSVKDGEYPKFDHEPTHIEKFYSRKCAEDGAPYANGVVTYTKPLTQKQMDDYSLFPAPGNPDHARQAPAQLGAQLEIIGKWEQAHRVSDVKRLTWHYSDFGVYLKKEFVPYGQITERFNNIIEAKTCAAERRAAPKRIADQLSEGAEQAAKDNAARPSPPKDRDKPER